MTKIMKKRTILFLLLAMFITLGGFTLKAKPTRSHYLNQNDPLIFSKLEQKETGIYFFYFPECPWCEEILPTLKKEAVKKHVSINLVNIHQKKYTEHEKQILKKVIHTIGNGNEVVVPFIVTINDTGKVKGQIGLLDPTIKEHRAKLIKERIDQLLTTRSIT